MRPTRIVAISALAALTTVALVAAADNGPTPLPPTFTVAGSSLTVNVNAKSHVAKHLNPDYSWSIKDANNASLKAKADFAFSGGTAKEPLQANVSLVAGTLKGAYCTASNCIPFTATCTASACTIN
jgi:hypothetical protein